MSNPKIRKFERAEKNRVARGWCLGLGIAAWAIALTLLPLGLGSPKGLANSVIPALSTTWTFAWVIWPLVFTGAVFLIAAVILNQHAK